MKKWIIWLIPLLLMGLCQAEVVQVSNSVEGDWYDTITAKTDTTGAYKVGMPKYLITNPSTNESWDGVTFYFYVPAFVDLADTSSAHGVLDSAMIRVKTGAGYLERTIFDDTCEALPCTLSGSFLSEQFKDIMKGGTISIMSVADSLGGGVYVPGIDTLWDALLLDHIWYEYREVDSGGSSGADLMSQVHYWFRFWKEQ
jgi:hypothetical protein